MPERTCVACQDGAERDDLVRLVVDPDGRLVVDYRARLPGRGVWVHPRRDCVATAAKQPGRVAHALRVDAIDTASLEADLRGAVVRALADGLLEADDESAAGTGAPLPDIDELVGLLRR